MSDLEDRLAAREQTLREGIESRLSAREEQLSANNPKTPDAAFLRAMGTNFSNLFLQSPKLLAAGSAGIQAPFSERGFSEIFEEEKGKFPANLATTQQRLEAGGAAFRGEFGQRPPDQPGVENPVPPFTERFGPRFDEELTRINAEEARMREEFPNATAGGDVAGDVLGLMTGRLPFAKGINTTEVALAGRKFTDSLTDPGTRKLVETVIDSGPVRSLMRGAGRVAETGAEGAILATLSDGDPLETAAYAAAAQATGSAVLGSLKFTGKHPVLASAFGMAALIQMGKETTPGGSDSFIDSVESGFEKVWWGILAGATATAAGTGRMRGGALAESWPRFADALATIPRATSISLLEGYLNASPEEQQTVDSVLAQLQQDPEFFGPEITERLEQALSEGNLVEALREEL